MNTGLYIRVEKYNLCTESNTRHTVSTVTITVTSTYVGTRSVRRRLHITDEIRALI